MFNFKIFLIVFILVIAIFLILAKSVQAQAYNSIKFGDNCAVKGQVEITLEPLANFNYKSKAEILNLRTNIVNRNSNLLNQQYVPSTEIFGQVVDNKPWWGVWGACIYGPGDKSIDGPSEESRFILNPFLLIGANPNSCEIFDANRITQVELEKKDFPFFWNPVALTYNPSQSWARVIYDVSSFNNGLKKYRNLLKDNYEVRKFGLIAYNARDLGFNYLHVSTSKSVNVVNSANPKQPVGIIQMIHCGGSCGYSGGCNNMSPAIPDLDHLEFSSLPARCVIYLWKNSPGNLQQKPDFMFILDFI